MYATQTNSRRVEPGFILQDPGSEPSVCQTIHVVSCGGWVVDDLILGKPASVESSSIFDSSYSP